MTRVLVLALWLVPTLASAQARIPYLQRGTPTSMHVMWRSAANQPSRVCYGTGVGSLAMSAGPGTSQLDHDVAISGLTPATRYYYAAATASCSAATTGNAQDFFVTSPTPGSTAPFRLWIVGDSGTGDASENAVRDAMLGYTGTHAPDVMLHMGDIAYTSGTNAQFDAGFFGPYAQILRHTVSWPTLGNHEGISSMSATQTGPYYDAYSLPGDGSAGGVPSGTEAYYAFDYANVHFVVLNSQDVLRATTGPMLTWLESDLSANTARWTIAFWHHPPYTHGSHDSDTEVQLIDMRRFALPILEAHGVDVVLGGHSHIYERSYLVHGAYDTPTTAGAHIVDHGDGQLDGDGAYAAGAGGTLYVVAGHGGAGTSGAGDHPLMFFSEPTNGSCIVDVDGDTLTLTNVRRDGVTTDHVTLQHGAIVPMTDAGVPGSDAGMPGADAATIGSDTGPRIDSGGAGADGGASDAGTAPPASGGCGCGIVGAGRPAWGALCLLGIVLARRVRRR
jgi:hypothetical protein